MKKVNKFTKVILASMLVGLISFSTAEAQVRNGQGNGQGQNYGNQNGQNFQGRRMMMFNELTEDQQTKINALRTKHLQETQTMRNELNEKQARLNTLRTAPKVDLKGINVVLKDASVLRLKMAENREAHLQDVRNVLTDEQRVNFDARHANGNGYGQGHRRGNGNGYGNGNGNRRNGQGYGQGSKGYGQR